MTIETKKHEDYTEVTLTGRLDSATSNELDGALSALIEKNDKEIIINFSGLNYINSSGLRVFLGAAKLLETKGKKLHLCEMKPYIKTVFDIAGFNNIFNFYSSMREAVGNII